MEPVSTPEGPDTSGPHFPSAAGLPTVMGPRNLHVVMNSAEPAIEGIPASDSSLSTTQDGSPNSTTSTPHLTPPSQTAEPCDPDQHGFTPTVQETAQTALEPTHGHTSISTTQDGSPRPPTPALGNTGTLASHGDSSVQQAANRVRTQWNLLIRVHVPTTATNATLVQQ